ncbi:MAG TPA: formate dehydrogenase accessory sulfurtransferase FdhD, partial [bacterium]|nr:formate dehydrogenase accessory sulfurtransferase FdhD [bacterium]
MDRSAPPRPGGKTRAEILAVDGRTARARADLLATEEPMEIRLQAGRETRTVAVTMRTPGNDFELAAGFLFAEGVVVSRDEIESISYCIDPEVDAQQQYNIVNVSLQGAALPDVLSLERHFFTTSACGVCGKASLEGLRLRGCAEVPAGPEIDADTLATLPDRLRDAQGIFKLTGGLHAAVLFEARGAMVALREDVGRHNAMDKLIGWAFLGGHLPLTDHIVMVSGRASFELLQKSV